MRRAVEREREWMEANARPEPLPIWVPPTFEPEPLPVWTPPRSLARGQLEPCPTCDDELLVERIDLTANAGWLRCRRCGRRWGGSIEAVAHGRNS